VKKGVTSQNLKKKEEEEVEEEVQEEAEETKKYALGGRGSGGLRLRSRKKERS
jgi:hypothetical protein